MIRLMIPDMPTADEVLPQLRRIDEHRQYANDGPLVRELQESLGYLVGADVRCVSNGTAALSLALRALGLPPGSGVVIPGLTFIGTAQAVRAAGLRPVLADIEPDTWALDPVAALRAIQSGGIAAVVPVAAYGQALDMRCWEGVAARVPVVVDAAGAIYDQRIGCATAAAFSLHATKALGCGEGGAVASLDRRVADRVSALRAFGAGGANEKLDEYRAAVAIAGIRRPRREWRRPLFYAYLRSLPAETRIQAGDQTHRTMMPVMLPLWCGVERVIHDLAQHGVEARRWYEPPPMHAAEFASAERADPLSVAGRVWSRVIGLPWHHAMTEDDVTTVCRALAAVLDLAA